MIGDEDIQLCDATYLWGKDSFTTTDVLRGQYEPCSVIPIGQAGENLVSISVTHIDKGGTVGSGGLAAVMGSKNLKAMVVMQGSKGVSVAKHRRLQKAVDEILSHVTSYRRRSEMMHGGMMTMTLGWVPRGKLAKNSTVLMPYPEDIKEIQTEIYELHKQSRKKIACITCPMADKDRIDFIEHDAIIYDTAISGERAIMTTSPAFGHSSSVSSQDRYAKALRYFDTVNRYGIDRAYSLEGLVDFVVTLYEQGIITRKDTNGLELNRELDTIIELVKMTALREGFGDILADGILGTATRIDKGVDKYVQNVMKGQFISFDPRIWGLGPMQFAQLVHPSRAFGVSGAMGAPSYSPGWPMSDLLTQAERCGVPDEATKRIFSSSSFNVGRLTKHGEDFFCLFNILGLCHRLYISRFYSLKILAELYSDLTGIEVTPSDLKMASERVWNLWKLINCRAGFDRKDDEPPQIWFQPLKEEGKNNYLMDYFQTTTFTKEDVAGFLDDYYDERGWNKKSGVPSPAKLSDLGLENIAGI